MNPPLQPQRRRLLKAGATTLLAGALAPVARFTMAADPGITELGQSLYLLEGLGANVVARRTSDGVMLVDSGAPGHDDDLMAQVRSLGADRVSTLINTHWHPLQTGGNERLGREGTPIIAHDRAEQWMSHRYWVPGEDRYEAARPEAARPTRTFYESLQLEAEGEQVDLGYLIEAHTSADLYVHFRDANVLVVGDVLSPEVDPAFDYFTGAWIGGRRDALERLETLVNDETLIVPSVGPVMTVQEMKDEHEMISFIYDRSVDLVRQGYGPQDMLEDGFMGDLPREFDDPYGFLYDLCKGLWAHHNKLAPNVV